MLYLYILPSESLHLMLPVSLPLVLYSVNSKLQTSLSSPISISVCNFQFLSSKFLNYNKYNLNSLKVLFGFSLILPLLFSPLLCFVFIKFLNLILNVITVHFLSGCPLFFIFRVWFSHRLCILIASHDDSIFSLFLLWARNQQGLLFWESYKFWHLTRRDFIFASAEAQGISSVLQQPSPPPTGMRDAGS